MKLKCFVVLAFIAGVTIFQLYSNTSPSINAFFDALVNYDSDKVKQLIREGKIHLNDTYNKKPLLSHAFQFYQEYFKIHERDDITSVPNLIKLKDIVDFMIKKSTKDTIDLADDNGDTILHIIANSSNGDDLLDFFIPLIQKNPDLNRQNKNGNTPLHLAVISENDQIIRTLLEHGAKTNMANKRDNTQYHLAYKNPELKNIFDSYRMQKGLGKVQEKPTDITVKSKKFYE